MWPVRRAIALSLIIATALISTGCAKSTYLNQVEYQPYGLLNESTRKNPKVQYEVPVSNLIIGIVLMETVIVPIYIIGYDLYAPVKLRDTETVK